MASQARPGLLVQKFEEMKRWQREQQEKLCREQEEQRELLRREQRKTFEQLGLAGMVRQETTLPEPESIEENPEELAPVNLKSPSPVHLDQPNPLTGRKTSINPDVLFDEVPLPSPGKNFNELLHENLVKDSRIQNKKPSKVTKQPFLRRGEGLTRFGVNPKNIQESQFVRPLSRSQSASSASSSQPNKNKVQSRKSWSDIPAKQIPAKDSTKNTKAPQLSSINNPRKVVTNEIPAKSVPPNAKDKRRPVMNDKPSDTSDRLSSQVVWNVKDGDVGDSASQPVATWAHILARDSLAPPREERKAPMSRREVEELRVFELLEQKAASSSFCSTASTVTRLLNASLPSTPSKMSPMKVRLRDLDNYPSNQRNPAELERSLHVRFADNDNVIQHSDDDDESTKYLDTSPSVFTITNVQHSQGTQYNGTHLSRTDVHYGAVQNVYQEHPSTQVNYIDEKPSGSGNYFEESVSSQGSSHIYEQFHSYLQHISKPGVVEDMRVSDSGSGDVHDSWRGTPDSDPGNSREASPDTDSNSLGVHESTGTSFNELPSKFQDNEVWSDVCSISSLAESSSDEDQTNQHVEQEVGSDQSPIGSLNQTSSTLNASISSRDGSSITNVLLKSDLLAKRLRELELEIEIFRKENAEMKILRRTHEVHVKSFQKETKETELRFKEKEESLMNIVNSEKKKLAHDKKVFDKYCKDLRNQPNKMEREEIIALKLMVEDLRDELVKKDARWSATQVRTRDRVKVLETENSELTLTVQRLKREKRELEETMQQNSRKIPKETETKVIHAINNHISKIQPAVKSTKKKPAAKPEPKSALLQNRPIWGARNPSTLRRNKSVPDMRSRPTSPEEVVVKRVCNPRAIPDPQPISDDDSSDDISDPDDKIAGDRLDKLHQVVYETLYNNYPNYTQTTNKETELRKQSDRSELSGEMAGMSTTLSTSDATPRDVVEPTKWTSPNTSTLDSTIETVNGTIETVNGNGTREKTFSDGRREIWYPDGVVKKISADKTVVKIIYDNGDVKETIASEGVVKYYYAETKTWHSTYRDKTEILEFPNGQVERRTADGLTEITFPNGCVRRCHANGKDEWVFADGTQVTTNTSGDKVVEMPNGQREIHTSEHKRREYPDGTVKLLYPDGLQETRYANGRVRLKDKDGNLVMDSGGDTK